MPKYTVASFPRSGRCWVWYQLGNYVYNDFMERTKDNPTKSFPLRHDDIVIRFDHCFSNKLNYRNLIKTLNNIVFIQRDAKDALLSWFYHHRDIQGKKGMTNPSEWIMSTKWIDIYILFYNDMAKRTKHANYELIRYQDMKNDTREQLIKMVNFIGLPLQKDRIDRALNNSTLEKMRSRMPNHARKGKVNSHKEELTQECIEFINRKMKTCKNIGE